MRYCLSAGKKSLALDESPFSLLISFAPVTESADIPLPDWELECKKITGSDEFL
jgi:hypothetical protein